MEAKHEDLVISKFLQSIGPWKEVVVIGGGYAPIIYKLYLSDRDLKNPPIGTRDIDSLIPRKVAEISRKNISNHLQEAGFSQIFKDLDHPPTESYVKEINQVEVEIEFLTDSSSRTEKHKNIRVAGIVAQPLSYLSLSLEMTLEFKTYSGDTGLVVSPGAWMFHKGLTFPRRKNPSKKLKDLYGIWYVATQLGDFSDKAVLDLEDIQAHYKKWGNSFRENLDNWTENATPQDWFNLESQDPAGKLKKLQFENLIRILASK